MLFTVCDIFCRYYGGETNLLASGLISEWQRSVAENPWLLGCSLTEISALMNNEEKRESMKRAVQIYTDKAYLKELKRAIKYLYTSGKWNARKDILKRYQTQVETLFQQTMPNHDAVTTVAKEIEDATPNIREGLNEVKDLLAIPNWFLRTELCYSWYPDGDGGQCGGGAARNLCATVNNMTNYYRDDTDIRSGGCQMRWGIFAKEQDDWFKNVQICYKWWPDGDEGQCGGGASRLLCANVNTYTPYYRDDTDRRNGGCQMQWMLSIPSNAPQWIQNAQLCYEWYADGDGGQCGGGAEQRLCAKANSYTNPYRDDTDFRNGGCQMRWGIKINSK